MQRILPALLALTACGSSAIGQAYNESAAAKLTVGSSTTAEAKGALGAPFRAKLLAESSAPKACPGARELWSYRYDDSKESACTTELYFDGSAKLCERVSSADKRGPGCSGVAK